ncbi:MAG: hypothetical protein QG622_859 [Actinomycetota bacterium]|nr:hypothetical protein [Actinomycetota bacterium]
MTCSTVSSVINRGRPGRGSSDSPSSRLSRNRPRHLDTVARDTSTSVDTDAIVAPSCAHASTIRARNANACAVFRRRAHQVSTDRSSSDNTTGSSFGLAMSRAHRK